MNNPPIPAAAHDSVPYGYPTPNAMPPNPPPMMPPAATHLLPPHSFAPAPAPSSQFPILSQHHRPPQQSYPPQLPPHPPQQPSSLPRPLGPDIVQHFSPYHAQGTPRPQTPSPHGREKPTTPPPSTPLNSAMAQATPAAQQSAQQAQAKAAPQAASTLSPQSLQRERARVTVLLDINSALLKEVVSLQSQGKAGSTAGGQQSPTSPISTTNTGALSNSPVDASRQQHNTGKPPSQEYADCMRRLQANLSYLAAIADAKKKMNGTLPVGPAIMIPPPHLKEVHPLYLKLNELFPDAGQSRINQAMAFASQQGKPSASIPAHGPLPKAMTNRRAKKACTECRQQKARCDADNFDDGVCSRCRKMRLDCIMSDSFEREHKRRKLSEIERENISLRQQLESTKSATPGSNSHNATPPSTSLTTTTIPDRGALTNVDALKGRNLPTLPRSLDVIAIEAREVDNLFDIYFRDFSPFLPILDPKMTPNACYATSPFLFWAIIGVAARNHPLYKLSIAELRPRVIDLALHSLNADPGVPSIQAMLLILTWPFPRTRQHPEITSQLNGATLHMAMQIGFHTPISSHEYSRVKLQLTSAEIDKRAEIWAYVILTYQRINLAKGIPSNTVQDLTLDPDQRINLIDQIPPDFKCQFRVQSILTRCGNEAAKIGLRNMTDDRERALDAVLRVHERQLDSLAYQLNSQDQLNLLVGKIVLQGLYFLKKPSTLAEEDMTLVKLCSNACQCVETFKLEIERGTLIPVALPFWYLYVSLICCSVLMRILKTPLFCHKILQEQRATSALHTAVDILKSMSLQDNDTASRSAVIMDQIWESKKAFHRQNPASGELEPVSLRVRTRICMCHLLDTWAWWREEFRRDEFGRPGNDFSGMWPPQLPPVSTPKDVNETTNGPLASKESEAAVSEPPHHTHASVDNISTAVGAPSSVHQLGSMQQQAIPGMSDISSAQLDDMFGNFVSDDLFSDLWSYWPDSHIWTTGFT
ncbi:hypothetical protein DV736_g4184, partial [Chaetothyriales sp. CBS 134916]